MAGWPDSDPEPGSCAPDGRFRARGPAVAAPNGRYRTEPRRPSAGAVVSAGGLLLALVSAACPFLPSFLGLPGLEGNRLSLLRAGSTRAYMRKISPAPPSVEDELIVTLFDAGQAGERGCNPAIDRCGNLHRAHARSCGCALFRGAEDLRAILCTKADGKSTFHGSNPLFRTLKVAFFRHFTK